MRRKRLDALNGCQPKVNRGTHKLNLPPPGFSSWTKTRLGWIDPEKIVIVKPGARSTVVLDPLSDPASRTLVIKIPLGGAYLLIENRAAVGSNTNLPGSGVLILLVDDNVAECLNGRTPVKIIDADSSVPFLDGALFGWETGKKKSYVYSSGNQSIPLNITAKTMNSYTIVIEPR